MAEEQPPVEAVASETDSAKQASSAPTDSAPADSGAAADAAADISGIDQAAIDEILKQASFEDPSQAIGEAKAAPASAAADAATATATLPSGESLKLPNFQQVMQEAQVNSIDLLRDVDLNVKIELGRTHMLVEDVLKLGEGSVVELDKLAGDPVDVFVNERLVARGEVLVLNDSFCVRINEIVAGVKEEGL